MNFKLNPDPLKSKIFNIKLVGGKYKTAEIKPFCNAHNIPMWDYRDEAFKNSRDGLLSNKKLKEDFGIELNENERRSLYKAFAILPNSGGYFMVYDIENVMNYIQWKSNKGNV